LCCHRSRRSMSSSVSPRLHSGAQNFGKDVPKFPKKWPSSVPPAHCLLQPPQFFHLPHMICGAADFARRSAMALAPGSGGLCQGDESPPLRRRILNRRVEDKRGFVFTTLLRGGWKSTPRLPGHSHLDTTWRWHTSRASRVRRDDSHAPCLQKCH